MPPFGLLEIDSRGCGKEKNADDKEHGSKVFWPGHAGRDGRSPAVNPFRIRPAWVCVAALAVATGLACWLCGRQPPGRGEEAGRDSNSPRRRPAASYQPKNLPLWHAARPDSGVLPAKSPRPGTRMQEIRSPVSDSEEPEEEDEREVDVFPPDPVPPDDPGLASIGDETRFAGLVWSIVESPPDDLAGQALALLDSGSSTSRILAGILLFLENALDDELAGRIASDTDPLVPLALLDWVRDFGTDGEIASLKDAIAACPIPPDVLFEIAATSAGRIGGGRSALDLWLAGFADGSPPSGALAALVTAPGSSYDVRAQAFFKLLEPGTSGKALEALADFAAGLDGGSGVLLPQTAEKWKELADVAGMDDDPEKVWDAQAAVVFYLSESDLAMPARDLANYLEYALRRDDPEYPPVIEEGTWEFANDCFNRLAACQETLLPEESEALERIAVDLDRLVFYDPAFNPFEEEDDDEGDEDEEGEDFEEEGPDDEEGVPEDG